MKIGILTLSLKVNYGGILQAYALQHILQKIGHEVEVIDKPHHYKMPIWKMALLFPGRAFKKYICKSNEGIFREWVHNKRYPVLSRYTEQFLNDNINRYETAGYPIVEKGRYDCIIVGSDQIWRRKYHKKITPVYLDFTKDWNIKRIAYAVSFGTDIWEYNDEETRICKTLASSFNAISVRESSGVDLCRQYLNVEATHVLDPTMLLNKDEYIRLFKDKNIKKSEGNLLCYILDPSEESSQVIKQVRDYLGLTPFSVIAKNFDSYQGDDDNIQPPVEEWLRGFYDAEFVITDSFHASVFSILFNKPFLVIKNKSRGVARIESLLNEFEIPNRVVKDPKTAHIIALEQIDYKCVNAILNREKKQSVSFLKMSLTSND